MMSWIAEARTTQRLAPDAGDRGVHVANGRERVHKATWLYDDLRTAR